MEPRRRLKSCIESWPACEEGRYDPQCCRFPKSCSCTIYDERYVTDADLEPIETPTVCEACGEDDHEEGSLLCHYTADSCGICGGYHDGTYNCQDELDREDDDVDA